MANRVTPPTKPSLNPARCSGTALPPNLLLMAKLIALCLLLTGFWHKLPRPFLPFLSIFDHLGSPVVFQRALEVVFLASAISLLCNRYVRTSCIVLGSTILLAVLSSRLYYSNNKVFIACVLLLAGLEQSGQTPWLVRYQVALVYLGAGLNKIFDVDWRSGQFFENWAVRLHHQPLYMHMASWLPPMMLSRMTGWATIISELGLSVGFLLRQLYPWAIWGGITFHTALLLATGRTYGMFYYALLASYLAFVEWPQARQTVLYDGDCGSCARTRKLFERFDLEWLFRWVPFQETESHYGIREDALHEGLHLVASGKIYVGFRAFKMMLLYNPLTYFALAVVLAAPEPAAFSYRKWVAVILVALFSPLFAPVGEALCNRVIHGHHRLPAERSCTLSRPARL